MIGYHEDEAARFFEQARERALILPGVQAVARASRAPLAINFNQNPVGPADGQAADAEALVVETVTVGETYFDALGVPILEGRRFDDAVDTLRAPRVAIVNQALARRLWPGVSAVGRHIRPGGADSTRPAVEVVGVVRDYKVRFLPEPPTPYIHYAASQRPADVATAAVLLARTKGNAAALGAAMQRELRELDSEVLFYEGLTLRDHVASQLLPARLLAAILGRRA